MQGGYRTHSPIVIIIAIIARVHSRLIVHEEAKLPWLGGSHSTGGKVEDGNSTGAGVAGV
jgi:hypothetical protein